MGFFCKRAFEYVDIDSQGECFVCCITWVKLRLDNWGTYSNAEFEHMAVFKNSHPHHKAFLKVLNAPAYDRCYVDFGNLVHLRSN